MNTRTCILVSIKDDVSELRDLALSLNYEIIDIFVQKRDKPDPKFFVGRGKVKEIHDFINEYDVDLAIFNSSLKPSQLFTLEDFLEITVYDRIRLILEIFADRAHSEEARLQVELAKLEYEIPLLRDWIHKARYGERPGFMAGGEYEVAQYYEVSRKRIKKIRNRLIKIGKERDLRRKQRRNLGYDLISIIGYTNAGKSTIFNLIAGERVTVEDRLFTTLSTTTRKIPQLKRPVLITDTVGFIDELPHWLIEAFHSTLEEIFLSDLTLLIMDASEDISEIQRKLDTSFTVLLPDLNPLKIILVFNKIDKIGNIVSIEENPSDISQGIDQQPSVDLRQVIDNLVNNLNIDYKIGDIIAISAIKECYKEELVNGITDAIQYENHLSLILPNRDESQAFIAWLYTNSEIISIDYDENIRIEIRYRDKYGDIIKNRCNSLGGHVISS